MSIIVRHYTVRKYFMLNAAVPSEAFDESNISTDSKNRMHNKHWNDYNEKTWCTKWYSYFPLNDDRRKLTWINRFQNNISCTYINYFSLGDEILKLLPTNDAHFGTGVGSGLNFLFWRNYRPYSWHKQELFKGRGYHYPITRPGSDWCGWGFAMEQQTVNGETRLVRKYTSNEANQLPISTLQTEPVFYLNPSGMNSAVISQNLQNELLAKGIPALSPPCGAGSVNGIAGDYDMTTQKMNGWGRDGNQWLHSDVKNMAYYYVYKIFDDLLL